MRRPLHAALGVVFASAALSACFTSFELVADAGDGDSGSRDGAPGDAAPDDGADDATSDPDATEGAPGDVQCKTSSCATPGIFCDYPDDSCGAGKPYGTCVKAPAQCSEKSVLCGCDGKLYTTACEAALAGVDIDQAFHCALPADQFRCGSVLCRTKEDYCVRKYTTSPETDACVAIPPECAGNPTCTCLQQQKFCDLCEDVAGGGGVECVFK